MTRDPAEDLLADLLRTWGGPDPDDSPAVPRREVMPDVAWAPAESPTRPASLGTELGQQLVSEILAGVRAGRQGVFVSEPERLRTAIFLRGYTLGQFARFAGMAPSTLSRAVGGLPVAPSSWRALITALLRA